MNSLSNEEKDFVVKNILHTVDNLNLLLETPNYLKKYSDDEYSMITYENEQQFKRYLVDSRERLRKIQLTDWYEIKFNDSQRTDITSTLSNVRQKINDLFTI